MATSMISSVDNVTISGGVFTLNVTHGEASKHGLKILTNSASPSAFYDSAANQLPFEYNPDAGHYKLIALDWFQDKNSTSIMWFSGESKVLTSLIARSTAAFCGSDHQKNLLATFFFSKISPTRNSAKHFVPSLAYGIIQSIPESRVPITQAIENDPLILSGSLEKQFDKLILNPLNHLYSTNHHSILPHVIIIDALDECQDASERARILRLFRRFYTANVNGHQRNRLPWKVLVTSKMPDEAISEAFMTLPKSMASHHILPGKSEVPNLIASPRNYTPNLAASSNTRVKPQPSRGLQLLSIDGGGVRGLSALVILEEIMHRLKFSMELQDPPKPCEIFDLAGGTGTGGLIVIMLFRLQMSAKAAKDAYVRFTESVFSERKKPEWLHEETFKASRLEGAVLALISKQLNISIEQAKTERMVDKTTRKCFVCATPSQHMNQPTLFRTWDGQRSHWNVTILEAARATCTIPTLFKRAEIADGEIIETFVDGGYRCNNPVQYVLREAASFSPAPSCIVSIGTGLESIIEFPKPAAFQRLLPTQLIQLFKEIALDCEKAADDASREFGSESDFYFRLNVERGMEGISLEEWKKSGEVATHTKQYLARHEISQKVDRLVKVLHPTSSNGYYYVGRPEI